MCIVSILSCTDAGPLVHHSPGVARFLGTGGTATTGPGTDVTIDSKLEREIKKLTATLNPNNPMLEMVAQLQQQTLTV